MANGTMLLVLETVCRVSNSYEDIKGIDRVNTILIRSSANTFDTQKRLLRESGRKRAFKFRKKLPSPHTHAKDLTQKLSRCLQWSPDLPRFSFRNKTETTLQDVLAKIFQQCLRTYNCPETCSPYAGLIFKPLFSKGTRKKEFRDG